VITAAAILGDSSYLLLKQAILEHTGLAYYSGKDDDLASRLARRMIARGARTCGSYLKMLDDPPEMDLLVAELTIGETYFFRHAEQFEALRQAVIPDLLTRNRARRRLRIWSAGCATGAEPYSLALLLWQDFGPALAGWDVRIVGTDINQAFLERAREARFNEWAFREAPPGFTDQYFVRAGKEWVLRREFTSWVSFRHHNLVQDEPPFGGHAEPADLILCRNVLIYFGPRIFARTAARLWDALAEGGWLVVGHSEPNQQVFSEFRTVQISGQTAYQKLAGGVANPGRGPAISRPKAAESGFATANAVTVAATAPAPAIAPPTSRTVRRPAPVSALHPALKTPQPAADATVAGARRLADGGKWQEAARRCRVLLGASTLDAAAHFTYALILEHSGRAGEVQPALERAIYLDREFALAHFYMGLCLYRRRSFRKARRCFQNVLDLLRSRRDDEPVPHGDGITNAELAELARMHLALLEQP
jgi:chemotaxis protein methyltransferase CheR